VRPPHRGGGRRGRRDDPPPPSYRAIGESKRKVPASDLDQRSHERLVPGTLSGWLALEMTLIDHLHVGSGATVLYEELVRATVVQIVDDGGFAPIVPGSSIKGAVRSVAEVLLGGGGPDDRDVSETAVGGLFGYVKGRDTFASRIPFDDARPVEAEPHMGVAKLPRAFPPRKAAGRRFYQQPRGGLRSDVPYEIVPRGEVFRSRLHLTNVTEPELGVVLLSLGVDRTFALRLGGGKFAGLGRVAVRVHGGTIRRGYDDPVPIRLDEAGAQALVESCLASPLGAEGYGVALETVRQTLGARR